MCERCFVLACPKHGSRGVGTNKVRVYCADCIGKDAVVTATSPSPSDLPPPPPPPGPSSDPGGGVSAGYPGDGGPEPPSGEGRRLSELARHPAAVRWALPALSPAITRLRDLFDRDRLASALDFVADDLVQHTPADMGRALGGRLFAALAEQDEGTLIQALGLSPDDPVLDTEDASARREILENMASAKAGALARELALDASELRPVPPRPPSTTSTGIPVDDLALVQDGLAALCAAHGYEPESIFGSALASPLDIPGALYLPAYPLQVLFAYIDERGLGPYFESAQVSPFDSPGAGAARAIPAALLYATT